MLFRVRFKPHMYVVYIHIIQDDSPSMLIPKFSFNKEFVLILIFDIFKYTQRPSFQIHDFYYCKLFNGQFFRKF